MTALMRHKGFTLIELMIAVAILAIIMAIAIPSYQQYVVRSNRAEAKTILMQAAQALERCYTRYNAYNDGNCNVSFPIDSENGHYQMPDAQQSVTQATYELVAVPQGVQASRDDKCAKFSLIQNGTRAAENKSGGDSTEDCW